MKKNAIKRPSKLDLYRLAVQHPLAEVEFFQRAYGHYNSGRAPTRLREDYAGGAEVAIRWALMDENHRAIAIDMDYAATKHARRRAEEILGDRAGDVHILMSDVMRIGPRICPRVDVVSATNFACFVWKTREKLRAYFEVARQCLDRGGLLILDAYGGPSAIDTCTETKRVRPDSHEGVEPFTYIWEQHHYDAVTSDVTNFIHFRFDDGRVMKKAFRYDWRLWSLTELTELMLEAGFNKAEVWGQPSSDPRHPRDIHYRPLQHLRDWKSWVAYVVGVK